jgi:FkbM family methyltransferase
MGIERARALHQRLGWTKGVRPGRLGAWVAGVLEPERRTIVESRHGLKLFVDPLNYLGRAMVLTGDFETETEQILREHLSVGDSFLDVGANEGYFSVIAASIVGPSGYVASVEPQSRPGEIIRINMALNEMPANLFEGALGGAKGETSELFLSPLLNSGYSSLAARPRFSRESETVRFLDPSEMLGGRDRFALVKVDVEGFEDGVVRSLLPLIAKGQIEWLLLDYHVAVLQGRGVEPAAIERTLLEAGMRLEGNPDGYSGYRLYRQA